MLNYFIEANLCLCFLVTLYYTVLRDSTNFRTVRLIMIAGVCAALLFPFIHFPRLSNTITALPEISTTIWLPELEMTSRLSNSMTRPHLWQILGYVYSAGVLGCTFLFISRMVNLGSAFRKSNVQFRNGYWIAQKSDGSGAFSFFNYIVIGSKGITKNEQEIMLKHEKHHARRLHSFDIVLLNVIGVFFWMNPAVRILEKHLAQLHEFEADEATIEQGDSNSYCNLIARITLVNTQMQVASNFISDLSTSNRIAMIRLPKTRLKLWKLLTSISFFVVSFAIISCYDVTEVGNDRSTIDMEEVPNHIRQRLAELKSHHPDRTYILLHLNETPSSTFEALEARHGTPIEIEAFNEGEESIHAETADGSRR